MEDDDLSFDFESKLAEQQKVAAQAPAHSSGPSTGPVNQSSGSFRRNYRQTVCTYWLKGVCALGDNCGFLHEYNTERMPVCKTLIRFGVCKEPDCPYKHNIEDIKECNMFKLGFCIYGPQCRYRHTRLPGPPPEPKDVDSAKPKAFRSAVRNPEKPDFSRNRNRHHPYGRPRPDGPRPPPPQIEGPQGSEREALPQPSRHQRPRPPPMPPQMGLRPMMGMSGMMPGMMPGMHMGMPMPPFWRGPMPGPFPPYGYR